MTSQITDMGRKNAENCKKTKVFPLACHRFTKVIALLIISFFVNFVGCSGCPYSFTGASVPPHLETIAIPFAEDRSGAAEPGLREMLTDKLTRKFIADNNLIIAERSTADALLETVIVSVNDVSNVVTQGESVARRRITIAVQVTYKDMVKKKIVYEKQFSNYGDYDTAAGVAGRSEAIALAVDRLTDDILLDTVSGW